MKQALIVDDSLAAREMLKGLLQKEQIAVDEVDSMEEALTYLKNMRDVPEVIFVDDMRPGTDGYEIAKEFKADSRTQNTPFVMYASRGEKVYYGHAEALGAMDVLSKPATGAGVKKVLKRIEFVKNEGIDEVQVAQIRR